MIIFKNNNFCSYNSSNNKNDLSSEQRNTCLKTFPSNIKEMNIFDASKSNETLVMDKKSIKNLNPSTAPRRDSNFLFNIVNSNASVSSVVKYKNSNILNNNQEFTRINNNNFGYSRIAYKYPSKAYAKKNTKNKRYIENYNYYERSDNNEYIGYPKINSNVKILSQRYEQRFMKKYPQFFENRYSVSENKNQNIWHSRKNNLKKQISHIPMQQNKLFNLNDQTSKTERQTEVNENSRQFKEARNVKLDNKQNMDKIRQFTYQRFRKNKK